MNKGLKIALFLLIGIEVFVMNSSSIDLFIAQSLFNKITVFIIQSVFHSVLFYMVLTIFLENKRDRLNINRSLLFLFFILFLGSFRILISVFNLSNSETWIIYITQVYHFLRSPSVFAIVIPMLIVRKRILFNQGEI